MVEPATRIDLSFHPHFQNFLIHSRRFKKVLEQVWRNSKKFYSNLIKHSKHLGTFRSISRIFLNVPEGSWTFQFEGNLGNSLKFSNNLASEPLYRPRLLLFHATVIMLRSYQKTPDLMPGKTFFTRYQMLPENFWKIV